MPPPGLTHGKVLSTGAFAASMASLARDVAGPISRNAMRAAVQPILDHARVWAPVRTGAYRRALGYVIRTYHSSRITVGVVGVLRGVADGSRPDGTPRVASDYANLVESGRGPVRIRHKRVLSDRVTMYGTAVGFARGQFVLTRAHAAGKAESLKILAREIAAGIAVAHVVPVPGA